MNEKQLNIEISSFQDDWELLYYHYFGKEILLNKHDISQAEWFLAYMDQTFKISKSEDEIKFPLIIDAVSFNENTMKIELHIDYSAKLKSLYIYNGILMDMYFDQTNLTIISNEKHEKGIKFDFKNRAKELKLWK